MFLHRSISTHAIVRPGAIWQTRINSMPRCVAHLALRIVNAREEKFCGGSSRRPVPMGIHGFSFRAGRSPTGRVLVEKDG